MKKTFYLGLILAIFLFVLTPVLTLAITRHPRGSVVVDSSGVVYFLGTDTRYPYPSMEVFKSWGHTAREIKKANDGDLVLPIGPAAYLNYKPMGHVDTDGADGQIRGWVVDKNHPTDNYQIHVYFNQPAGKGQAYAFSAAGSPRPDVNTFLETAGDFGFAITIPDSFRDSQWHKAYLYAIDTDDSTGASNVLIPGSPVQFALASGDEAAALDAKPTISYFDSYMRDIKPGESTTLEWSSSAADEVLLDNVVVDPVGSKSVTPSATTTYTLSASNSSGTVTKQHTIRVLNAAEARDNQRLLDLGLIIQGIGKYYSDNSSKYPANLQALVPKYLTSIPTATLYSAAPCVGGDNDYIYTAAADLTNFTLKYCLEIGDPQSTEALLQAGVHTLDYNAETAKMQLHIDDAQRLADAMALRHSIELFYLDYSVYPLSLKDMVTADGKYLTAVPVAPTPPGGSCTLAQNTYTYTQLSGGTNYQLTFCLGAEFGGYKAGVRTASGAGIN